MLRYILPALTAISLAVSGIAAPAMAQEKQPIELSGDVKHAKEIVAADGSITTELVAPEKVVPGDRLVFSTSYRNTGAEPVENFVVTNPLPAAVILAPDADPGLTVSVDGGKTWGLLADLTVTQADGTARPADQTDVTHIRWTLATVAPGEAGRLEYPAIIR